jgi:hypothetical protein
MRKTTSLLLISFVFPLCFPVICFADASNIIPKSCLNNLPSELWAIIGTLLGAFIIHLSSTKILKKQLNHETTENKKERKISVRREVYLKASEDFVKASQHLGTLAQLDISKNNLTSGFHDLFISASKVSLIAEQKTVKSVSDLVLCYNRLLFKFTPIILDFNIIKNNIRLNEEFYIKTKIETERILKEMSKYHENLENNSARFQVLDDAFKFEQERATKLSTETTNLWATYNKQNTIFAKELIEELKNIHPLQTIVLCNMREELEIDTNYKHFEEIFENHLKVSIEEANKTMKVLSEYIATKKI